MNLVNNTSELVEVPVKSRYALRGRFSVIINEIASLFPDTQIHLKNQHFKIDAKSIISILSLSGQIGDTIFVETKGPQATPAAVSLAKAFSETSDQTPEKILANLQGKFKHQKAHFPKPVSAIFPPIHQPSYTKNKENKGYIQHLFIPLLLKYPLKMLYNLIADKGKPSEKKGRKATGLK